MKHLLDTNVVSEFVKDPPSPRVLSTLAGIAPEDQFISAISIGEISYGIARLPAGKRRSSLSQWLSLLTQKYQDHVLPVNTEIARLWGELSAKSQANGRELKAADGLIAATAVHHGLVLLTRDAADFSATPVTILNPWE